MTLRLIPRALTVCFSVPLVKGQEKPSMTETAYEILAKQDLVTLVSVVAVLLLLMIIMAVCVYKPVSRR